jgi:hypothetical protein
MRRSGWTPSIVPNHDDETAYIVVDDFGPIGRSYRETGVGRRTSSKALFKRAIESGFAIVSRRASLREKRLRPRALRCQ